MGLLAGTWGTAVKRREVMGILTRPLRAGQHKDCTNVSVASFAQATLLMDLHAHLSSTEVIGLLGGTWDAAEKRIAVVRAFPCRRALGSQSGTSVELDPSAEVETRALMQAEDLTPVGW